MPGRSRSRRGSRTGLAGLTALAGVAAQRERDRRRLIRELSAAQDMVREYRALEQISHAVARGAELEELAALVAECATGLLEAEVGVVLRFDPDGHGVVVGRSAQAIATYPAPGEILEIRPEGAMGRVRETHRPARVDGAPSPFQSYLGERVAAPIIIDRRLWGAVATAGAPGRRLRDGCERRLESFAGMVALAISNAEARAQLVEMASTDPLTGLANRRLFEQQLTAETERAGRHERPLAVVLFDIDHFKQINDRHGHRAGDEAIASVGRTIARGARRDSLTARLGGDEFALLLPECSMADAEAVAWRIIELIRGEMSGPPVTVSAGVAELEAPGDGQQVLEHADQALYRAKGAGRNTCATFRPAGSTA